MHDGRADVIRERGHGKIHHGGRLPRVCPDGDVRRLRERRRLIIVHGHREACRRRVVRGILERIGRRPNGNALPDQFGSLDEVAKESVLGRLESRSPLRAGNVDLASSVLWRSTIAS